MSGHKSGGKDHQVMTFFTTILQKLGSWGFDKLRQAAVFFRHVYSLSGLTGNTIMATPLFRKNTDMTINQMYTLGIGTFPLVLAVSIFIGAEVVLQAQSQLRGLVPYRYLGYAVVKSIVTEFGPVITSMLFAGRIGTSIAAEIASMRITEQLDAMKSLGLDMVRYLVVPRTLACMIMLPVLVVFADLICILFSIVTVLSIVKMTLYEYLMSLRLFFDASDVFIGIAKTAIFGAIIALVGVYIGLQNLKGAMGIGRATTWSVMVSSTLILIVDFFVAYLTLDR
ncbi:MAG: ABC transporter permease [Chitinivibrionales bacterium]|nr:ABC transporter permease [Chitinivibrionales bacterium]